jgi:hypothetical protein
VDVVVVGRPDDYRIEFLLEVTNLYDRLGFANVEHLAHQD